MTTQKSQKENESKSLGKTLESWHLRSQLFAKQQPITLDGAAGEAAAAKNRKNKKRGKKKLRKTVKRKSCGQ